MRALLAVYEHAENSRGKFTEICVPSRCLSLTTSHELTRLWKLGQVCRKFQTLPAHCWSQAGFSRTCPWHCRYQVTRGEERKSVMPRGKERRRTIKRFTLVPQNNDKNGLCSTVVFTILSPHIPQAHCALGYLQRILFFFFLIKMKLGSRQVRLVVTLFT